MTDGASKVSSGRGGVNEIMRGSVFRCIYSDGESGLQGPHRHPACRQMARAGSEINKTFSVS